MNQKKTSHKQQTPNIFFQIKSVAILISDIDSIESLYLKWKKKITLVQMTGSIVVIVIRIHTMIAIHLLR